MRIKIMSHRGDHECVLEAADARMVFDKLTGKMAEPLPDEVKAKIPATFEELAALWTEGKVGYAAFDPSRQELVSEFREGLEDLLFMPPLVAG
jgi:hypothetical protein